MYRNCANVEAGDILFDEPLLWFDSLAAARAAYADSAEQARECVLSEYRIIRRSASLVFTSGYSWVTILFRFARQIGEDPRASEARVLRELLDAADEELSHRLRRAVVASDGGRLEPVGGSKESPDVRPIDLADELDQFADALR